MEATGLHGLEPDMGMVSSTGRYGLELQEHVDGVNEYDDTPLNF